MLRARTGYKYFTKLLEKLRGEADAKTFDADGNVSHAPRNCNSSHLDVPSYPRTAIDVRLPSMA